MARRKIAHYGGWKSPITSELIVSESVGVSDPVIVGPDVYWLEMRPKEKGRCVLVRKPAGGKPRDVTPAGFNVRTRVHEYGGGAYLVDGETVYFSNYADQRLYRQVDGGVPEALSPAQDIRFADYVADAGRRRLIAVAEDHTTGGEYPTNSICALPLEGGKPMTLVSGADFYSSPRVSPDGARLAWLSWDHPNMPWDGCDLWVADFDANGRIARALHVAGGDEESIYQPEWSPDGRLYFVSDKSGWWNIYRWDGGEVEPVCPMEAEFGRPQWVFGRPTYAFDGAGRIVASYTQHGTWRLATIDTASGGREEIETPYTQFSSVVCGGGRVVFAGASAGEPASIARMDLAKRRLAVLRCATDVRIDEGYISRGEHIEFLTEGGLLAHARFFAPANKEYEAPSGQLPPLVVHSHGGPTAAFGTGLDLALQYFTSRGFAVVNVDYGGSTGYGRAYMKRLEGRWGIVDVDDCCNVARHLAKAGRVDGKRLAIAGGSAGGYTTLCALAFRDVFHAGASYYGVSDAEALARDTHKFESRYLDRLIAPYPARRDVYIERSPIHFVNRISCPLLVLQGLEDKIVPPSQAETIVEALKSRGLPVAYIAFEGEQHGFRQAASIKRAIEAELYFYSRVFGFEPAERLQPVEISNLK